MSQRGNGERIERGESASVITTTDLPLAAFYRMSGLEIVRVTRRNGGGNMDFTFHFSDPNGEAEQLRIAWVNSPFQTYDNAVRSLKKLCVEARRAPRKYNGPSKAKGDR